MACHTTGFYLCYILLGLKIHENLKYPVEYLGQLNSLSNLSTNIPSMNILLSSNI